MDPVILAFSVACLIISATAAVAAWLLRTPNQPVGAALEPYECGEVPLTDTRYPWQVGFLRYLVLFLLFDLELILILPWFWSEGIVSGRGAVGVSVFLMTLLWGLLWPARRGLLRWQK